MTQVFPLRFRRKSADDILFANEAGQSFLSDQGFLDRLASHALSTSDRDFLVSRGLASESANDLNEAAFLGRLARRLSPPRKLSYVILVPTLRCDLSCSYCQVSRAALNAKGFDWTPDRLSQVLAFLDREGDQAIQVEFQGGEPTLRMDLILDVVRFCRTRFKTCRFVICSNLSELAPELIELLKSDDVHLSTSLDGPPAVHTRQRTLQPDVTDRFYANLKQATALAPGRVAALPTLDPEHLPDPSELLGAFAAFGMYSIYLRQVVYHGFARKRHPGSRDYVLEWQRFYNTVIEEMICRNAQSDTATFDEFYLTLALKRLLKAGEDGHLDLRSPNWLGHDHMVIDYDGMLYPTDEARMLARTGQIDLSIGDVTGGIDVAARRAMQDRAFNALDPWCSQCVYQAACGADPIDDIARTGRADPPRIETAFCRRHMHIFDLATELLCSDRPEVQASVAKWLGMPGPAKLIETYHDRA
jgi:His-Xaa-Ser system radical SAM maturase HxsB